MPTSPRPRQRPAPTGRPAANDRNQRGGTPRRSSASGAGSGSGGGGGSNGYRARPPRTEAERRSQEVKASRPRRVVDESVEAGPPVEREKWVPERWQDEGPLRDAAREATARARGDEPVLREKR